MEEDECCESNYSFVVGVLVTRLTRSDGICRSTDNRPLSLAARNKTKQEVHCTRAVNGPGLQRAGPGRAGPGLADTLIKTGRAGPGRAEHENGPGRAGKFRPVK